MLPLFAAFCRETLSEPAHLRYRRDVTLNTVEGCEGETCEEAWSLFNAIFL